MLSLRNWNPAGALLGFGLMLLVVPVWAANQGGPGTINYVEGQVRLDGQALGPNSVGGGVLVEPGRVLETGQGKVEMLLTPGVFLRLGENSAVRMDSPELTNTRVAVLRGEAMVEADELYKQNNLLVQNDGVTTRIEKTGVYAFYASPAKVAVYSGEAEVNTGDRHKTVKQGHEAYLNAGVLKEQKFNTRDLSDGLYAWSNLRSEYLSEASVATARTYVGGGGGWYGGGWYFNPYFASYSFLPGDGFLFSPFGWGFYSPWYVGYAPFYGGYYGGGFRGYRGIAGVRPVAAARASSATPAFRSGGFSGGMGFHGGGGGGRR